MVTDASILRRGACGQTNTASDFVSTIYNSSPEFVTETNEQIVALNAPASIKETCVFMHPAKIRSIHLAIWVWRALL